LDDLAIEIVKALQEDGRRAWRDIARDLGVSESTVARRARHLIDEGILRPTVALDPQLCGFGRPVLLRGVAELDKADAVADTLAARADVRFLTVVAAQENIVAEIIIPTSRHLVTLLRQELPQIAGLRSVRVTDVRRNLKMSHEWSAGVLGPTAASRASHVEHWPTEALELSPADLAIIGELQCDCRAPLPRLAAASGLSESGARRRLEALIASGAVRPIGLLAPAALGFELELFAVIRCVPQHVDQVGRQLAELPQVRYLSATLTVGEFVGELVLHHARELDEFLTVHVEPIPGLMSVDLVHEVRQVKRGFQSTSDA
jgi:DNA-binding Lrp family transcriptional regulator